MLHFHISCTSIRQFKSIMQEIAVVESQCYPPYMQTLQDVKSRSDLIDFCEEDDVFILQNKTTYCIATEDEIVDFASSKALSMSEINFVKGYLKDLFQDRKFFIDARKSTSYKLIKFLQKRGELEVISQTEWEWGTETFYSMNLRFIEPEQPVITQSSEKEASNEIGMRASRGAGILGSIVSVDDQIMHVESLRRIDLLGNNVIEYFGIVTDRFSSYGYQERWLSNNVMHSDTSIDFLEEHIDWINKETLVPVLFRNSSYNYYTLMSLGAYLIQSEDNNVESEPVSLCSIEDLMENLSYSYNPSYESWDRFMETKSEIEDIIAVISGQNYKAEYNYAYDSYCTVVSQFDSCSFYDQIDSSKNVGPIASQYIEDDLPF